MQFNICFWTGDCGMSSRIINGLNDSRVQLCLNLLELLLVSLLFGVVAF